MKKALWILSATLFFATLYVVVQLTVMGAVYKNEMGEVLIGNKPENKDIRTDGPHIIKKNETWLIYYSAVGTPSVKKVKTENLFKMSFNCITDPVVKSGVPDTFHFNLHPILPVKASYPLADRVIAISDIEGNFYMLKALLTAQNVMDSNLNWIYGNGHLVVNGDLVDRGWNVTQCLWLLYKLEAEAEAYGGKVHIVIGNHEQLNFQGNVSYVPYKYQALAMQVRLPYKELYSTNSILGNWLRSKNMLLKLGKYLFCHGGISPELHKYYAELDRINTDARKSYGRRKHDDKRIAYLFSSNGPLWYRGYFIGGDSYKVASQADIDAICDRFQVKKVIVGHTIQDAISSSYNSKVIALDVKQPHAASPGLAQCLLIEKDTCYVAYSDGRKEKL